MDGASWPGWVGTRSWACSLLKDGGIFIWDHGMRTVWIDSNGENDSSGATLDWGRSHKQHFYDSRHVREKQ